LGPPHGGQGPRGFAFFSARGWGAGGPPGRWGLGDQKPLGTPRGGAFCFPPKGGGGGGPKNLFQKGGGGRGGLGERGGGGGGGPPGFFSAEEGLWGGETLFPPPKGWGGRLGGTKPRGAPAVLGANPGGGPGKGGKDRGGPKIFLPTVGPTKGGGTPPPPPPRGAPWGGPGNAGRRWGNFFFPGGPPTGRGFPHLFPFLEPGFPPRAFFFFFPGAGIPPRGKGGPQKPGSFPFSFKMREGGFPIFPPGFFGGGGGGLPEKGGGGPKKRGRAPGRGGLGKNSGFLFRGPPPQVKGGRGALGKGPVKKKKGGKKGLVFGLGAFPTGPWGKKKRGGGRKRGPMGFFWAPV